jgi:uncharacterized protein (TIGR02246 family)
MSATTEAVTALLAKYNEALNASSTDAVIPLYAEDGVFMPPYSQSAVGSAAVRKAYDAVFTAIKLNVKFTIAEIVELGPGWAFARTNSAGILSLGRRQSGYVHERLYPRVLRSRDWGSAICMSRKQHRPPRSLDHAFQGGDVVR